jgi:hypothetical protein
MGPFVFLGQGDKIPFYFSTALLYAMNSVTIMTSAKTVENAIQGLLGQPVWQFLPALIRLNPGIARIRLQTYIPAPKLSERLRGLLSDSDQDLLNRVDILRQNTGVPFWDALLGIAMREGTLHSRISQAALLHDPQQKSDTYEIEASEIRAKRLQDIVDSLPQGKGLVVCSRVEMKTGDSMHIPMMDFRCPPSEPNSKAIEGLFAKTGQPSGVLVESGKSYHLYGTSLLTGSQWVEFLALCLLFAPVTDGRYVAHRLADGECRLKIASHQERAVPNISYVFQ